MRAARISASSCFGLVLCAVFLAASAPPAASESEDALAVIGLLPDPPGLDPLPGETRAAYVVDIDHEKRELYYMYQPSLSGSWAVALYDLVPRIPRVKWSRLIPGSGGFLVSPLYFTRDTARNRLLMANAPWHGTDVETITVLDLDDQSTVTWDPIPGFLVEGLTYSKKEDVVFLIGETVADDFVGTQWHSRRPQAVTALAALDPTNGQLLWATPLHQCQQPLNEYLFGAPIFRSELQDALFIPCARTPSAPRVSGLLRIDLDSDEVAARSVKGITDAQFFPVSGTWTSSTEGSVLPALVAKAVFDPATDRVFLQSLSARTPGAWVFDGQVSAWVGFISSPMQFPAIGINPGTGHFYSSTDEASSIVVADGRDTPVPQGQVVEKFGLFKYIIADAGSRRLFGMASERTLGLADFGNVNRWVVMEDNTPSEPINPATNYDALTHDIGDEAGGAVVTFSGAGSGYASRALLIGGYSGTQRGLTDVSLTDAGLGPGDRGLFLARVARLDVREAGSSASAQAVAPDQGTFDEWQNRPNTTRSTCARAVGRVGANRSQCQPTDPVVGAFADQMRPWPWSAQTCLDAGSGEVNGSQDESGGQASVSCSADRASSRAEASYGAIDLGVVSTASSSFVSHTYRDRELGAVSEATSTVSGLRLVGPGASLTIGQVAATAKTQARGRPGTTKVEWTRHLSGIVLQQGDGPATRQPDCENEGCAEVLEAINRALGEFATVEMPSAKVVTTPKGAFAGLQKTDADYYHGLTVQNDDTRAVPALQIVTYHDAEQKSRLLVQAAAIEATSIYTISPGTVGSGTGIGSDPLPVIDPLPQVGIGNLPPIEGTQSGPSGSPVGGSDMPVVQAAREVLAFLVRSPTQAIQIASVIALFIAAATALARRSTIETLLSGEEMT